MQGGKVIYTCSSAAYHDHYPCSGLLTSISTPSLQDSPFQSEEGIAQELQCLETCLSIACVTEHRLQVFFPPLNKARGVVLQHSASQASTVGEKDTPETCPTHSNSTVEGATSSSSAALKQESSNGKTILTLRNHVQGFLDVLQRAVQSRVLRAPCVRERRAVKKPVFETHVSGVGGGNGGGGEGGGGEEKRRGGGGEEEEKGGGGGQTIGGRGEREKNREGGMGEGSECATLLVCPSLQ